jgi:beta-glucosidase
LGKSDYSYNRQDMLQVIETKKLMGDKPVIVLVQAARPFIPAEIEPHTDGLLLGFGIKDEAYLDILCGDAEPYGLLPMQLPKDMQTVEQQMEDVARDMDCYTDADGHTYDFAFGMNWSGVIRDDRVQKYHP